MTRDVPSLLSTGKPMAHHLPVLIGHFLRRELGSLRRELEAYPDEELLWALPPGLPNSAGTLALHLTGNCGTTSGPSSVATATSGTAMRSSPLGTFHGPCSSSTSRRRRRPSNRPFLA